MDQCDGIGDVPLSWPSGRPTRRPPGPPGPVFWASLGQVCRLGWCCCWVWAGPPGPGGPDPPGAWCQAGSTVAPGPDAREAVEHHCRADAQAAAGAQGLVVGVRTSSPGTGAFVASLDLQRLTLPGTRLLGFVPRGVLEGRPRQVPLLELQGDAALVGTKGSRPAGPAFQEVAARAGDLGELGLGRAEPAGAGALHIALRLPPSTGISPPDGPGERHRDFKGLVVCLADSLNIPIHVRHQTIPRSGCGALTIPPYPRIGPDL